MTILDCIKVILGESNEGLTAKEIYNRIVTRNMYSFGAAHPVSVVNSYIRRRCEGLYFPAAYQEKLFCIVGYDGKKEKYALLSENVEIQHERIKDAKESTERLPEEKIQEAVNRHIATLKNEMLDRIINNSFSYFEKLVVDLLLKMGYGYDGESGFVTGKSHDGGIDGIIFEDNFGLDRIYIQAKRYAAGKKVSRPELQAFIGAMEDVQKGVFITTSQFTGEATTYANKQQQKHLKLVDGALLTELLVKYEIGLSCVQVLKVYKIDADYYGE